MGKLNQVLAVEKGIKTKTASVLTEAYKVAQKPTLFTGFTKNYAPIAEGGEVFPPETNRVQVRSGDLLGAVRDALTTLMDVSLTKDAANCSARADIVVADKVVAAGVPVTNLLFLEKQLTDLKTFLSTIPELDTADAWVLDTQAGVFKTEVTKTARSAKVQEPIVLYPATDKHPAQTQLLTKDVTIGHWSTTKMSGGLPTDVKASFVYRVEALIQAVQKARETANAVDAPEQKIGKDLLAFVFGTV